MDDAEIKAVAEQLPWVVHADHEWREVPPCVYCVLTELERAVLAGRFAQ